MGGILGRSSDADDPTTSEPKKAKGINLGDPYAVKRHLDDVASEVCIAHLLRPIMHITSNSKHIFARANPPPSPDHSAERLSRGRESEQPEDGSGIAGLCGRVIGTILPNALPR